MVWAARWSKGVVLRPSAGQDFGCCWAEEEVTPLYLWGWSGGSDWTESEQGELNYVVHFLMNLNLSLFPSVLCFLQKKRALPCSVNKSSAGHKPRDFHVAITRAFQNCGMWGQANTPNQAAYFTSTVIFAVSLTPAPMAVVSWDTWKASFLDPRGMFWPRRM